MKLEKILDQLNSFEKNSFLKIVDSIISGKPKRQREVEQILSSGGRDLKSVDSVNIANVFHLIEAEFADYIRSEFVKTTSQLDIFVDIISRDGNSIMKHDWFSRLYELEIKQLQTKVKQFSAEFENEKTDIEPSRIRDYKIYRECLKTAYHNDLANNLESKITTDELSMLITLSTELGLSQEETKLINYMIVPIKKLEVEAAINDLKSIGVVFYSKKTSTVYVADELVFLLRSIRGKEVADKHFRRVLRGLRDPQINLICKRHGIDLKQTTEEKIKHIITEGISFSGVLKDDVHKPGTNVTDKKKFFTELVEDRLKISQPIRGTLLDEKVANLILYFNQIERDEKVGISHDGYEKLLRDLGGFLPQLNSFLQKEFQFQEENTLNSTFLLDYNIKPRDVLELVSSEVLLEFAKHSEIKTRGDIIINILECYKDSENLFLENFESIGLRDLNGLKENGIVIKEAELGSKFEEITKSILIQLGFNVNEELRKKINTAKDQIDVLVDLGNNDLILIECKTVKESGYNKFSSVSRQLKAYEKLATHNGYKVVKSLLIAPDFSDDFIKDCGLEYELNLSLISAQSLLRILEGFKVSKLKVFPHNLLMRDVVIQEDRVLKAIGK